MDGDWSDGDDEPLAQLKSTLPENGKCVCVCVCVCALARVRSHTHAHVCVCLCVCARM